MSAVAVAEEARRSDSVPQQCNIINKDLLDALVKNLLKSASPGTHAAHLRPSVEQHLAKILPSVKTPDHPPYALMIRQAITELGEEEGSNEEAISELIKLKYKDLPWGHVNFLRHHLKKLKDEEEIFQVSGNRFKLSAEGDDSISKVKKSKKRRRRSGKEDCYSQRKVSKSGGSSKEKNSVAEEDRDQSGAAALHFKEYEVEKSQNEEQQKQAVTCGSRKEPQLGLEVNEEVNQVHLDSEECERTKDTTTEEALHHMKDADGLEQRVQEVNCLPRQETVVVVEANEKVSQVHIVEDASRGFNDAEEQDQLLEQQNKSGVQQKQEVPCVPSQLGSKIREEVDVTPQKECEGMEDVTPTAEALNHLVAAEGQVLLQGQENEFRANQIREVSCTARKQTALGFQVNGEVNQLCGQECEKKEDVRHKEREHLVAIEGENTAKEHSTAIIDNLQQERRSEDVSQDISQIEEQNSLQIDGQKEEREQSKAIDKQEKLKSEQFAVVEDLQQNERINEVIDTLIQVEDEPSGMEEENGFSTEGEKEERQQIESIGEQKAGNCKQDATIEDLQNQMELDPIQAEEHLDQMEVDNSLPIEGEKEETTQINETEDQQEANCEKQDAPTKKQGAAGVSGEQFDGEVEEVLVEVGKVPALEQQEQPIEMQGPVGVLEGQNVNKGAENLTVEQCDGSLQVALTEEGQVKALGLQKLQQEWQPEVNEQQLQLREIGAEIVEWIEKIISPQKPVVVGNKREGAANFISSPVCSGLRQEQCLELLNRAAKMQGMVVELMKSFGTEDLSRRKSDRVMLESNETGHSDEQLPNATAETALPSRLESKEAEVSVEHPSCAAETERPLNEDLPVVEPLQEENADISNSAIPSQVEEASMIDSHCHSKGKQSTSSEAEQQQASSASAVLKDLEEQPQHQEVVTVVLEPKEQTEQLCNSSTETTTTLQLEETMVENHQEKQPELHSVQPQVEAPQGPSELESEVPEVDSTVVGEEATKPALLLNLNSSLDMSAFLPEQEALRNKEPSAESHVEISLQLKLPDPDTISSIYLEGKEIPGPTVSAEPTLSLSQASQKQQQKPMDFANGNQQLHQQKEGHPAQVLQQNPGPTISAEPTWSLWLASQEQQQKPTDFVDGNQQLHQQKEEHPAQVLQQNTEASSGQQHVQSESQSINVEKITESNDARVGQMLQPNLFQGGPKPPLPSRGGDANTVIFGTPQKQQLEQPVLLLHGQQKQMLSPLSAQTQLPSFFDAGSLFRNSLFQKPPEEPLTTSMMKPSSLSGGKLQPLNPTELKKLMEEPMKRLSAAKQLFPPQQVINVDEIEVREMPGGSSVGYKRKLRGQDSPFGSPMSSDKKKTGEAVEGESEEQVPQKKRRGRPPKQHSPGGTPPPQSRRPKIRQTVPKKPSTSTAADGDQVLLSSQSPAKRGPGRPPKGVKVSPTVEKPSPVITPKNPF